MAQFAYPSLRDELEAQGLVFEMPSPGLPKTEENARAWCSRLLGAMAWFSSQTTARYVWRGQRDANWPLQPRLNRHVAVTLGGTKIVDITRAEREIIRYVRHQRWDMRDGARLGLFELLALEQHHGVPTRMVDVTRDPLVAAFFAAGVGPDPATEPDGAVVAIRVPCDDVRERPNVTRATTLSKNMLFRPANAPYALWNPPLLDSRIITQRGQFLVPNIDLATGPNRAAYLPTAVIGIGISSPKGNYKGQNISAFFKSFLSAPARGRPPAQPVDLAMMVVPREFKGPLKSYLEALGLTDQTIYPDQSGYASSFAPS